MSKVLFSLLFLVSSLAFSNEYARVDQKVKAYPNFKKIHDLGYRIQNDFSTDEDRVRAAFVWLIQNMVYEKTFDDIFKTGQIISYQSEYGKQNQIRRVVLGWSEKAFRARKGVCLEYSLILNELCQQFGLPSKVIVGVAKTDIRFIKGDQTFKNHTWNAIQLNGVWKLMDPTWASGHLDLISNKFIRKQLDHYFFTKPDEFVKHHFPTNEEWQLLDNPVSIQEFFSAPIYLPDFFDKGMELSSKTKGILSITTKEANYIYFDKLPQGHEMYYLVNGRGIFYRLGFKKGKDKLYKSKIRLYKNLHKNQDMLTVFIGEKPILNFKIVEELNN
ncbi:transglutaminase domain-containing protein [Eudoraea sp.]|uniref:transglutaminase domain-containing protein n=2 Tax=Eudoraea sp. TaxID=1979955 RepID=UPI003C77B615